MRVEMIDATARTMSWTEFVEQGYLIELNRQFLHPLGLALEVEVDDDGSCALSAISDCRDDPEGLIYAPGVLDGTDGGRGRAILTDRSKKAAERLAHYGWIVQPLP